VTTNYSYDELDRLTATTGGFLSTSSYDDNGNRTSVSYGSGGTDSFSNDWHNRLTSATVGGSTVAYASAGDDLRVSRTEGGVTATYLWDRLSALPTMVDDSTTQSVHGPTGITNEITRSSASYALPDALGSVRATTENTGAVIGAADWDAWGNSVTTTGPQSGLGWAGELRDPATGLTYLRARDYSPGTGRFTSRDSLSPNGSGTLAYEPYGYADLNPATMVDPTGHQASPWARCVICTPVLLSVILAFQQQQAALATVAPAAARSGPIGANRWAIAGFALVAMILACLTSSACREAVPREIAEGAVEARVEIVVLVVREIGTLNDPDPEPEPETKQSPDAPLPPNPDPKRDRKDNICYPLLLKSITLRWFRYNLACYTGINWQKVGGFYGPPPKDFEAHHVFPRSPIRYRLQEKFDKVLGLNQNHQPHFGSWWARSSHQSNKDKYNALWAAYFAGKEPSPALYPEVLERGEGFMGQFGQRILYDPETGAPNP
jgi:RHS repeat-associated protein